VFEKKFDLHCHSTFSDGTYTPQMLIDLALEKGFSGLSITDHDTVNAYPEAIAYAAEKGVTLVSGVEFSCTFKKQNIHILGYNFNLENPGIISLCALHAKRRYERHLKILEALKKQGMHLDPSFTEEALSTKSSLGRMHIAYALAKQGFVESIQEAFNLYLGDKKCCHIVLETPTIEESIEVIKKAGGKAILAHPHLLRNIGLVYTLLRLPFDGVEGYYGGFSSSDNERFVAIGNKRKLIITGGSDFHGDFKEYRPFGASFVGEECIHKLIE
jgi:3',5'-nucleoside bisphosphate phosphatase